MKESKLFGIGLLGMLIGMGFADIDSVLPFLVHRSILTHAIWFPMLAWVMTVHTHDTRLRLFTIGFSVAMAVHLSFDLWPSSWWGFARIHVPFFGRLPGTVSWAWVALNLIGCLYLASWLIWKGREFWLAGLSMALPYMVYSFREDVLLPVVSCAVALGMTFWLSEYETWLKGYIEGWTHLNEMEQEDEQPEPEESAV